MSISIENLRKILYNICMKIGIFGGTFNPPHKTHINMAVEAKKQLQLDKLIVFPCGDPPHKKTDMDKHVRYRLTQIAFQDVGEVSDYELNKEGKSYTLDTLLHLKELYPDAQLFLIIGGDSLRDFDSWHKPEEILKLCTLAVCSRDGVDTSAEQRRYGKKVKFVTFQPTDVSSTEIRLRYFFRLDNLPFVTGAVDEFVKANDLYADKRAVVDKLRAYVTDPKRFSHTYHVVKRGLQLAPSHLKEKAFWGCLLHDCAKNLSKDAHANYGFCQGDIPNAVVHAFLGELVAKQDFGIDDEEILHAIKYHCTARANMSLLDMLVYVADKTEETRPFPVDHLLKGTLEDMFVACLVEANDFCVTAHGKDMYYLTQQALDFYVK